MSTFNIGDNIRVLAVGDGVQLTLAAWGDGARGQIITIDPTTPADPPKADKPIKGRHAK